MFGGGEVASADGLRFVVPVRTLHAGPNPRYFHVERGVTYYNFTSDQFSGFHGIVVPGTLHDSAYVLDGLLEQQTNLRPTELMTDTAGYSDIIFGLFWLLGFQFSPRLADIGESRFWRINASADYGGLNGLARQRVNRISEIPRAHRPRTNFAPEPSMEPRQIGRFEWSHFCPSEAVLGETRQKVR
jgi:TnpA family transposase